MQREDSTSISMPGGEPDAPNGKGAAVRQSRARQLRSELERLRADVDRLHEEAARVEARAAERENHIRDLRGAIRLISEALARPSPQATGTATAPTSVAVTAHPDLSGRTTGRRAGPGGNGFRPGAGPGQREAGETHRDDPRVGADVQAMLGEMSRLRGERAALLERIAAAQAADTERQARIADLRVALLMLRVRQPAERPPQSAAQVLRESVPSAAATVPPALESSNGHRAPAGPDRGGRADRLVPATVAPALHGAARAPSRAARSERASSPQEHRAPRGDPGKQGAYWGGDKAPHLPPEWDTDFEQLPYSPRGLVQRWRIHRRRG